LSLAEVSARLKFTVRQLEALETEQWERLPTGVSLRGFVKNYGRFLEADIDALLAMLDDQVGVTSAKPVAISRAGSLGPADLPIHGEPVHRPWGWLIIILVLLFVAGFYAIERGWVPDSWLVFDWLKSLKK
jgi:cytoskeletal protein RodZ